MAHAYAVARNTTPWQALLDELNDLAGQVAWLNQKIGVVGFVEGDDSLRPGGLTYDWVVMREERGDRLAKVAKMCIDAGVAERMVQQVELQGSLMMEAAKRAAKTLGLDEAQEFALIAGMARTVVEIEKEQQTQALEAW
jgi:hypothetical protein